MGRLQFPNRLQKINRAADISFKSFPRKKIAFAHEGLGREMENKIRRRIVQAFFQTPIIADIGFNMPGQAVGNF